MRLRSRSAFTVVETMVAAMLLGILMTLAFGVYVMGARAWAKGDAKADLLRAVKVMSAKTARLVESSSPLSASVAADGSAVSFLTAEDSDGVFQYDPVLLSPKWQNFMVLYHVPTQKTVLFRKVSVLGTPLATVPGPIDSLGSGPVENYTSGGEPFALNVEQCRFSLTPENALLTEISSTKRRYGSETPEKQSLRFLLTFRN